MGGPLHYKADIVQQRAYAILAYGYMFHVIVCFERAPSQARPIPFIWVQQQAYHIIHPTHRNG